MSASTSARPLCLAMMLIPFGQGLFAQYATLDTSFIAFTDSFPTDHVVLDLEDDILVVARDIGDSGTVRIHWRNAGGADRWETIAVIADTLHGFGRSIDLSDGLLAVGIDQNDGPSAGPYGSVRIYRVDPLAIDPVFLLDSINDFSNDLFSGPIPEERFGHTVHWRGDTLLVGAIGRDHPEGTGAVHLFRRNGDRWTSCGSLQPDVFEFQLPVLGQFGAVIVSSVDRLVIGAPFSGFTTSFSELPSFTNVLGSLHFYHRDASAFEGCGWASSHIAQDITMGPDTAFSTTQSGFLTLETGRQGIAFSGPDLIAHISGNYAFQNIVSDAAIPYGYGFDDDSLVRQALNEGCDHCGLRSFSGDGGNWTIRDSSLFPMVSNRVMGLGGWTTYGDLLFVNRYDTDAETWATYIHAKNEGGTNTWGELFDPIPELEPDVCARYNTPLAADGSTLVRIASSLDTDCSPFHTTRVEIFRLGSWVGLSGQAIAKGRLQPSPNPTTGSCSIMLPEGDWSLRFIDTAGRSVKSFDLKGPLDRAPFDLSGLAPGAYTLIAQDKGPAQRLHGTCLVQAP